MQIIAGIAAGTPLDVPQGESVRPTPDRTRKALFDSLGDWQDKIVYDLFAGSGAMGLEAASRSAAFVRFVEQDSRHARFLQSNIDRVAARGVAADMKLLCTDALKCGRWQEKKPDLVFADPPYAISAHAYQTLLTHREFLAWMDNAVVIWELPAEQHPCAAFMELEIPFSRSFRKYGNISFMVINSKK